MVSCHGTASPRSGLVIDGLGGGDATSVSTNNIKPGIPSVLEYGHFRRSSSRFGRGCWLTGTGLLVSAYDCAPIIRAWRGQLCLRCARLQRRLARWVWAARGLGPDSLAGMQGCTFVLHPHLSPFGVDVSVRLCKIVRLRAERVVLIREWRTGTIGISESLH